MEIQKINYTPAFHGKLSVFDLKIDQKRWDKIAKSFETRTAKNPSDEVLLFKNSKDEIILSTYDGDLQLFNILSKDGFNNLEKLPNKKIVSVLAKVMSFAKKYVKDEDKIYQDFWKFINKSGISDENGQNIYHSVYPAKCEALQKKMQNNLEQIDIFKENIKADVSASEAD